MKAAGTPVFVESLLNPTLIVLGHLTSDHDLVRDSAWWGSLTGAVPPKCKEAPKGSLSLVGNQVSSASAQGS